MLPFILKVYSLGPEITNIHKILARKPEGNKRSFESPSHNLEDKYCLKLGGHIGLTASGQQAFRNIVKNV